GTGRGRIHTFLWGKWEEDLGEEFFLHDWEPVVPSVFFYSPRGRVEYSETTPESITFPVLQRHAEKVLREHHKPARTLKPSALGGFGFPELSKLVSISLSFDSNSAWSNRGALTAGPSWCIQKSGAPGSPFQLKDGP